MDREKVAKYIQDSQSLIKEQEATIAQLNKQLGEKTAGSEDVQKVQKSFEASQKKLAAETTDFLIQQGVIKPSDRNTFAEGLASPQGVHNLTKNLAVKLAAAEKPVRVGKPAEKKASASVEQETAAQNFERLLAEAHGRK